MIKLLIFILAVAVEIFCIKVFLKTETKFDLMVVLLQGLNVLWCFGRVLGFLP